MKSKLGKLTTPAPQASSYHVSEPPSGPTGPRTPEGKHKSKYNALRHGIFCGIVLRCEPFQESKAEYTKLLTAVRNHFKPKSPFAEILVEKLALDLLRLTRVYKADAAIAPLLFERIQSDLEERQPEVFSESREETEVLIVGEKTAPELLFRYEANVTRQIYKAVGLLREIAADGLG